jgi:P27 family predicted phage terminase small subunit
MGKRGPIKTPTAMLEARGSRHAKGRPDKGALTVPPMKDFPAPAEDLTAVAAIVWETYGPQLVAASVMRPTDLLAFQMLCMAWDDYIAANNFLKEHGMVFPTYAGNVIDAEGNPVPTGWKPWPQVNQREVAWKRAIRMAREFAMTPSSRASVPHELLEAIEAPAKGDFD